MKTLSTPWWAVLGMALLTATSAIAQTYQWHKQFTGNSPNLSSFEDMAVDGNGNVYVVGRFFGTINFGGGPQTADYHDFYFAKYNSSGALQFFRKIGKPGAIVQGYGVSLFSSGGNTFLYISGTVSDTDQVNFALGGEPPGNLAVGPNGTVFIVKYNVTTNIPSFAWVRGVNMTQNVSNKPKIATDGAGSAYTVAVVSLSPNTSVITKHNSSGTQVWQKSTTGLARDVAFRSSFNLVVVCGNAMSIASGKALARLNANNGSTHSTLSDNQHDLWSVAVDNAGDIYAAGYLNGHIAKIQKLTGLQLWTRSFGVSFSNHIDLDFAGPSQSEVIVASWFSGTVNFNNDSNPAFTLTSTVTNNSDIFAARYSAGSGTCQWVRSYPANQSGGLNYAVSVKGRTQHFLIGGIVNNRTIDVDFCGGVANVAADNAQNGFIAQYAILTSPSVSITGADFVCTQQGSQSVNAFGGTITWSVVPANLVVTSSGSGATANLQAVQGVEGQATLTFTFNGAVDECGMPITGSLPKTVWVGTRKPTGFVSVVVDPWLRRILAMVVSVPDAIGYEWHLNGVLYTGPGMNSDYVAMPISGSCSIPGYTVGVKAINSCGPSAMYSEYHGNPCYEGGFLFSYYPNPASDVLTLESTSPYHTESTEFAALAATDDQPAHFYRLYDFTRNLVVREGSVYSKEEIDVSSLSKGRYILRIQTGKNEEETHHILIN
jgi:hypothetical protein